MNSIAILFLVLVYMTRDSHGGDGVASGAEVKESENENGGNVDYEPEKDLPDPWIDENASDNEVGDEENNTRNFVSHDPHDVKFFLYYNPNNTKRLARLYVNEEQSIPMDKFNIGQPLIFITHGFMSAFDPPNSTVPIIKDALLSQNILNIIAVDWKKLSSSDSEVAFLSYAEVTQNVPTVGKKIADMIEFLIELGIVSGPEKIHLIGHSLGSHVMGVAGYEIQNRTGKKIGHITGLDPAGPLYQFISKENKLDRTDATYVDALHTDIGMFGSSEKLGTADFYANGGKGFAQAECFNFTEFNSGTFINGVSGVCSHARAYRIYGRTIRKKEPELYGCRCKALGNSFLPTSCTITEQAICQDRVLYGYYGPKTAKGTYYVDTQKAADIPFGSSTNSIVFG